VAKKRLQADVAVLGAEELLIVEVKLHHERYSEFPAIETQLERQVAEMLPVLRRYSIKFAVLHLFTNNRKPRPLGRGWEKFKKQTVYALTRGAGPGTMTPARGALKNAALRKGRYVKALYLPPQRKEAIDALKDLVQGLIGQ
jgi:hypothetical protein